LLGPATGDLRTQLMYKAHQQLGHLGYLKTVTELFCYFFWPKMAHDLLQFVSSCKVCQKTKALNTLPTAKMLTPEFPGPCFPVTHIAIEFLGLLKALSHFDILLTINFWLSGFTCIIPTLQKNTNKKAASCFFTGWITLFVAPISIISN
jgi:hypothetical protein